MIELNLWGSLHLRQGHPYMEDYRYRHLIHKGQRRKQENGPGHVRTLHSTRYSALFGYLHYSIRMKPLKTKFSSHCKHIAYYTQDFRTKFDFGRTRTRTLDSSLGL